MIKGLTNYHTSFFILLFGMQPLFAAPQGENQLRSTATQSTPLKFLSDVQPILTIIAGASISHFAQSQLLQPIDLCRYYYNPNQSNTTHMLWGGFLGSKIKSMPNGTLTAGLSYFHPTSLRAQGMLIQGADSLSSDMYNYRYKIQSQQLLAEGKWYWTRQKYFQPFITLGIGLAFNKVSDYQTSVPSFYAFTPYFPSHTQTNFTYALSTGFDLSLNQSVRLGMGYRFTDLGTVRTGEAQINNLPTNSTLRQSNLYANQIFAQITFIPSIN